MKPSAALSIVRKMKDTLQGRKVGILFDEGSDKAEVERLAAAVQKAGGVALLIAPKVGGLELNGGILKADGQLAGTPSVVLDAIALVLNEASARKLAGEGAAVQFVMDAFGHLKAIGFNNAAQAMFGKAGLDADASGIVSVGKGADDFIAAAKKHRIWDRDPLVNPPR